MAFVGLINCPFPRFPSRLTDRVRLKAQQIQSRYRAARSNGHHVIEFVRNTIDARRRAQLGIQNVHSAVAQVNCSGFQPGSPLHHEALLEQTTKVFERYAPKQYRGPIAMFISDDEAYAGVSRAVDARFRWAKYAASSTTWEFRGGHLAVFETSASQKQALSDGTAFVSSWGCPQYSPGC